MGRSSAPWRSTGNEPRGRRVTRCVALARAVRRDATASRRACPRSALAFIGSPSNAPPGCRGHERLRWARSDAPRPGRSRHRVPRPSPRATRSYALPVQASRLWPPSARHGTPGRPFGLRGNDRLHEPRSVEPVVEWCGPPDSQPVRRPCSASARQASHSRSACASRRRRASFAACCSPASTASSTHWS